MNVIQTTLDLGIFAWPTLPQNAFDSNKQEDIDDFTFMLARSKIEELNAISTTSVMITGVIAAVYSWPIFTTSPWLANSFFGAGFISSLVSIRKAPQQGYILRRLQVHSKGERTQAADYIRHQLAPRRPGGGWIPCRRRQIIWNSSILFLNLSIIALIVGYAVIIWGAASAMDWNISEPDTKIAISLGIVGLLAVAHYLGSGAAIYRDFCLVPIPVGNRVRAPYIIR